MTRWLLLILILTSALRAQDVADFEDNSFFIEEAYNQESGVVQHIGSLVNERETVRGYKTSHTAFAFTQEWPVYGQRWQFSYSLGLLRHESEETAHGYEGRLLGLESVDAALRYQLISGDDSPLAIAPQLSFTKRDEWQGRKDSGVELTLPASVRVSKRVAAHANVAVSSFPFSDKPQSGAMIGGSGVFAAHRRVHLLLEALAESERTELKNGTITETVTVLSPGVRVELSGTPRGQWIAGIALPFTFREEESSGGFFLYLSFEHFYRKP